MVNYTIVIGKNFLGTRHEEENKNVVGYNAEEADTQYWIDETTDGMMIEELFFDSVSGDFTVTLVNRKDDTLFLSVTVPIEEWVLALGKVNLDKYIDRVYDNLIKAKRISEDARSKFAKVEVVK